MAQRETEHIVLIGFMGAGKSSVGRALAEETGQELVDTDQMIEARAGMPISEIFAAKGEAGFREIESQVLEMLKGETEPKIISTGGGLPLQKENREILKCLGKVVLLQVKAETVLKRLAGDTTRPLLQGENKQQRIEELLTCRNPIYQEAADLIVPVDGKSVKQVVAEILEEKEE